MRWGGLGSTGLMGNAWGPDGGAILEYPATLIYSIDGQDLNRVSEYKYLGVIFDESLTWNAQVKYLLSKAGKRIGMLGRTRKNISMHTASTIYKSFILPIVDYCDAVWNCCGAVNTDMIEKLQRCAVRIIMQMDSSYDALQYLRYTTLERRREGHILKLVKNCLNKCCPQF